VRLTAALDELKAARPAFAIQLRKSGSSQQARKKYKITAAGEKRVEELVRNGGAA
jgi:DNA-binding PadR family transcriptional regulator